MAVPPLYLCVGRFSSKWVTPTIGWNGVDSVMFRSAGVENAEPARGATDTSC